LETAPADFPNLITALSGVPWQPRLKENMHEAPHSLACLLDWLPSAEQTEAPDDALICYDVPLTFDPPAHGPRFVIRMQLQMGDNGAVGIGTESTQRYAPRPLRPRANYRNTEYRNARAERLEDDHHLCVFCKSLATTVQHITYRRAGGKETHDDLRALCRLCHDAITMLEYGAGMGLDRINPEDPLYRDQIIAKRAEIIQFRSLEMRRRRLESEEAE